MITPSKEHGFINIKTWHDVESLPGFTPHLNPNENELEEIVAPYIFADRTCGLTTCHTKHTYGWVVVSKAGTITNIGKDCGKTHFGVVFEQMCSKYLRAREEYERRQIVNTFALQANTHIAELELQLINGGAFVHKSVHAFLTPSKGCPIEVRNLVSRMVRERNPTLTRQRLATKSEIDELEAFDGRNRSLPVYKEEVVDTLRGLAALYPENDIRNILILDLQTKLTALVNLDVDSLDFKSLREWAAWCQEYDSKVEKADALIAEGKIFLESENLNKISRVLEGRDKEDFRTYLNRFLKTALGNQSVAKPAQHQTNIPRKFNDSSKLN